ncbi:hypothetical protein COU20_00910 [Candidatus Kaiserbacteria bacterium CG10_big_fil_rev_8_21_14_0_10_59_10]|uniref:O-antigen ligase-related domain-containing protein n=1 Tax=Candidatus Kaiserbacteria bacterium CG10_big_fil_rev_8_21_14_0_10_59_10 TaxID=1974612 RepID=A0A2H0U8J7_9BACT|nr:MAG: hypothetical protein COU20_00910 [Candidatus Kaiserbacteria bacterium CG10_big_fil_rev_8_21_14_0_10_59_10]
MIKFLERVFPYLLLFPAILPLVFFDGLLYPFLTPKTVLFRADFILALAVFVALVLSGRHFYWSRLLPWLKNTKDGPWYSYVVLLPAALLAVAYVTSLLGIDFYHSFWSVFDRGDGLLTLTAVVVFFYFILLWADDHFFSRLLKWVAITASLVAFTALLQWLQGLSGLDWPLVPEAHGRVSGMLGNAAFLAAYLGMAFFLTLILARDSYGRWRTFLYTSAGLQLAAVFATATRGTILAFITAGFIALLYLAWSGEGKYRSYARYGIVGLLVLAGLFVAFRGELARVPFEPVSRLASISTEDATVESRLFIWENVGREALERPIVGVGAEHIRVLFNEVYDPTAIVEEWFDRTHNAFLDYFVQYGILGLLLYLLLIGAVAREAYHLMRSEHEVESYAGKLLLLLIIVYAVQNFFVFDTVSTLWLLVALFAALRAARGVASSSALPLPRVPHSVPIAAAALIALLIVPVSIQPLRANMALARAYTYHVFDIREFEEAIEHGFGLGTYADMEYGYQLYEMYTERQAVMLEGGERLIAYRTARDILAHNFGKYPYDARTAVYYAHVLDMAPPEDQPTEELVRSVIERAVELSPKRIQPQYLLANISIRKGDALPQVSVEKSEHYRVAISQLAEYAETVPQLAEPRFVIATLYQTMGDHESAKEWADAALPLYKPDLNTARRAARYYIVTEDWENAVVFLRDVARFEAENYPALYDLAKAEFLIGNEEQAAEIVEQLRREAPGLVETDPAFLAALEG